MWDGKSKKLDSYLLASTFVFCKNGILQGKQIKERYKTYDTDREALHNYKYMPAENIKKITSSCAIHSTILRSTHSI